MILGRTLRLTWRRPATVDFNSDVIRRSRSTDGYARHGREVCGVQVPGTRLGVSRSSVYQVNTPIDKVRGEGTCGRATDRGQRRANSRSAPTSAVCPWQTHRLQFAGILGRGGRCRLLSRRKLRNSQRSRSPKAALGVARMCLAVSADRLVLARLGLLAEPPRTRHRRPLSPKSAAPPAERS